MKKYLLLLLAFCTLYNVTTTKAQTIELVAGNTLNGAMNGVILGGATMALQNSNNTEPLRVGLGGGTLYGIGMGVYDISRIGVGQQFYISGTFNDGTNTSILILLDTFYGAAGGALIASSVSLIIQEPIVNALQYGSGIGAWAGFGFGLIDAFVLAKGPNYSQEMAVNSSNKASGLLTYSNAENSVNLGLINPQFIAQKKLTKHSLKTTYAPTVNVLELSVSL